MNINDERTFFPGYLTQGVKCEYRFFSVSMAVVSKRTLLYLMFFCVWNFVVTFLSSISLVFLFLQNGSYFSVLHLLFFSANVNPSYSITLKTLFPLVQFSTAKKYDMFFRVIFFLFRNVISFERYYWQHGNTEAYLIADLLHRFAYQG